ncbi:hypothetical protein NEUTE1DRAFT_102388 [Neurospora tetrasperma FGSC 2508]|uniref:Uncharacterized protein n=1 Tax=Neurospora tetrasperma (strain FGSC 2508 / ATCC MYA-4615 / P0657) TaxID=510951 RepID=F8MPR0_NEUT8|nr:uncharacterized protein NEUTE1DRAFT_102388 [Neurospora tetrasperma FGSC 2508]EGO57165.1 hypothetical protein NEUTE1DRAFT_102388 [Neurospora tetrasperma FGSC 2508]EGZ69914.1 hypothetical protein NEUTE2DRAFT_68420 [Neurospora tetrasperma FGSC 2509]
MLFQKASTRESKGAGDEPGESPLQGPSPPPPYEAVTTAAVIPSSLGRPADALFRKATFDRTKLVLTHKGRSVLLVYYLLLEEALDFVKISFRFICAQLPRHGAEGTPAANRAMVNAAGNYAFLLALLHVSKQYNISKGRLSLPVNEAVHAIREHVKGEMVKDLMQGNRYQEQRHVMQQLVDSVEGQFVRTASYVIDDRYDTRGTKRVRDSVDTGELDVWKVQECWRLFKSVLVENCGDLLPPPGFDIWGGKSQAALRRLSLSKGTFYHSMASSFWEGARNVL